MSVHLYTGRKDLYDTGDSEIDDRALSVVIVKSEITNAEFALHVSYLPV